DRRNTFGGACVEGRGAVAPGVAIRDRVRRIGSGGGSALAAGSCQGPSRQLAMIGAIVLAAGSSSRMGRSKALLTMGPDGPTFVDAILETGEAGGVAAVR